MSETDGEKKSNPTLDRMDAVSKVLDEYEKTLGLPPVENAPGTEDEMNEYLNTWDRSVLESLTADEAAGVSYRLNQFAFYIQRLSNRETARIRWAQNSIDDAVCDKLGGYDKYMKHDHKLRILAKENNYVAKLMSIKSYAEQRVDRLSFLATSLKSLSESMIEIRRAKTNRDK